MPLVPTISLVDTIFGGDQNPFKRSLPGSDDYPESVFARKYVDALIGLTFAKKIEATAVERIFTPGEFVYWQGDAATSWIGVIDGLLKMCTFSAEDKFTTIAPVSSGGWIGEPSLVTVRRRKFNLIAVRRTRVATIPRETFLDLYDNSVAFNHYLFEKMAKRMGDMAHVIAHDRLLSREARIACCMAGLAQDQTLLTKGCLILSQEEIGQLSGFSRQHTSKALRVLEAQGLLKRKVCGRTITTSKADVRKRTFRQNPAT